VTKLRATPRLARPTVARARALRREKTPAERALWAALRSTFAEAHFRHQVPLGPYYADFASHGAKLVVEVDGSQHAERQAEDEARTAFLNGEGYRVLRFWNNEVLENLDGVLTRIAEYLPSPLVGEGGLKGRMGGARQSRARASGSHPHPWAGPPCPPDMAGDVRGTSPPAHPPHKVEGGNDKPPVWSL